jgi:hypothetical protein
MYLKSTDSQQKPRFYSFASSPYEEEASDSSSLAFTSFCKGLSNVYEVEHFFKLHTFISIHSDITKNVHFSKRIHHPPTNFFVKIGSCILQGVFINPALVEPFGLTLIEVHLKRKFYLMGPFTQVKRNLGFYCKQSSHIQFCQKNI